MLKQKPWMRKVIHFFWEVKLRSMCLHQLLLNSHVTLTQQIVMVYFKSFFWKNCPTLRELWPHQIVAKWRCKLKKQESTTFSQWPDIDSYKSESKFESKIDAPNCKINIKSILCFVDLVNAYVISIFNSIFNQVF